MINDRSRPWPAQIKRKHAQKVCVLNVPCKWHRKPLDGADCESEDIL